MAFKDFFREFQNIQVSNVVLLRQVIPEQDAKDFYDIYIDEEAFQYFGGYKKPGIINICVCGDLFESPIDCN